MFALLYASIAKTKFDREKLSSLCEQSAASNLKLNVTGYLYYRDGRFFQYLEGEKNAVTNLMDRIREDPRHKVTQIIYDDCIVRRRFPTWSMRYIHLDGVLFEDVVLSHLELLEYSHIITDTQCKVWLAVDKLMELRVLIEKRGKNAT